ncbi:MAG: UPF0042 nucleotide-binding protein, partial [Flavobacteriales bacterium]
MQIIVISGRSGSGKSSALHLLEDEGFTCIDNLPISLLPSLVEQARKRDGVEALKLAIGIDARNIDSDLGSIPALFESVQITSELFNIIYLDTDRDTLIRRYSETRRRHPLSGNNTGLQEAISDEEIILAPLIALADQQIDTSKLSLHELRSVIKRQVIGSSNQSIAIQITSFGFKYGSPIDCDFLFDVRCLPNPYWDASLRQYTGEDEPVQNFLSGEALVNEMQKDILIFVKKWIPRFESNNRSYLNIGIGCTGGRHRSVYLAQ